MLAPWLEGFRVDGYAARKGSQAVDCPFCHAPAGEECRPAAGMKRNNHTERNFEATRQNWERCKERGDD